MTIEEAIEIAKNDQECNKHVLNCINEGNPDDCKGCEYFVEGDTVDEAVAELVKFAEEHMRKKSMSNEKATISKEDALAIGLAINAIATLTDDRTLAKIEKHLRTIEDITLKYVQEEEKESSKKMIANCNK